VVVLALAATASLVWADKPDNFDDKGNATSWENGPFDQWGYNYQACNSTTYLIMKWSDEWLSNQDRNGDGDLDRGYSCDPINANSSACEGAWLTNHQRGEYVNDEGKTCKWTYFVKMVYPPGGPSNDTCAGEHGNVFSVQPTGFGAYK